MGEEIPQETLLQEIGPDSEFGPKIKSSRKAVFRQYLAALIVSLLILDMGLAWSWTSSAQKALMSPDSPTGSPFTLQEFIRIQVFIGIGYLVGCSIWAKIADVIGRKRSVLLCSMINLVTWILLATASTKAAIYIPAFVQGLSGAGAAILVPCYTAEVATEGIRSTAATLGSPSYVLGIQFSYTIGSLVTLKYLFFICCLVSVIFCVKFLFFPESASFLWSKGDTAGAEKSLLWLEAGNSALVKEQLRKLSLTPFKDNSVSYLNLIRNKKNRKPFIILVVLGFFGTNSGGEFIIPFAGGIFTKAGFDQDDSFPILVLGVTKLIFSFTVPFTIANFRRKVLIKTSLILSTVCSILIGLYLFFYTKGYDIGDYRHVVTLCACLIEATHTAGLVMCTNVMAIELIDGPLLSRAFSILTVWRALTFIVINEIFSWIIPLSGFSTAFFTFFSIGLLGLGFTQLFVAETKKKA